MWTRTFARLIPVFSLLALAACAARPEIPVDTRSVEPGSKVTRGGKTELALLGTPIRVGDPLPSVVLVDTAMQETNLDSLRGQVVLLSVVPSLDTQVCEQQTHLLGETAEELPPDIRLVTISRDLPFAQKRFAEETGFDRILFLSDYRDADFGRATGLLVDRLGLLARGLVVVDREGIVRHLQVVPELSHLPDFAAALAAAEEVNRKNSAGR